MTPINMRGLMLKILFKKFLSFVSLNNISETPKHIKVASGNNLIFTTKLKIINITAPNK